MQTPPSAPEVLTDLWLSLVKLLGRPSVQTQLLAAVIALGLAWLLARWITGAMGRRLAARVALTRNQIIAEEQARPVVEQSNAADVEASDDVLLLRDDSAIEDAVEKRMVARRRVHLLALQLVFPIPAIVFLYGAYLFFTLQGWYAGLLADLTVIFAIFVLYRLALGLAYAFGNPERVRHYDRWLFAPFVGILMVLLFVNGIVDLAPLAAAALLPLEDGWLTLGSAFGAILGFYFWILGVSLAKELVMAVAGRQGQVNMGSLKAALTLLQYGLIVLGFLFVARTFQFNTTIIAAVSGGLAVGIGFALEDVITNFMGGITVLLEGSVRPGDLIEITGVSGEVTNLSIRSTTVRTSDNVEYIVPNKDWLTSTVTTYTRTSRRVRARLPVRVSYDADPHLVQRILVETARSQPGVLSDPPPGAPLVDIGESSLIFEVRAWVEDARARGGVTRALRMRIWDVLKANGIEIPYPQQDLHIRSDLPLDVRPSTRGEEAP